MQYKSADSPYNHAEMYKKYWSVWSFHYHDKYFTIHIQYKNAENIQSFVFHPIMHPFVKNTLFQYISTLLSAVILLPLSQSPVNVLIVAFFALASVLICTFESLGKEAQWPFLEMRWLGKPQHSLKDCQCLNEYPMIIPQPLHHVFHWVSYCHYRPIWRLEVAGLSQLIKVSVAWTSSYNG